MYPSKEGETSILLCQRLLSTEDESAPLAVETRSSFCLQIQTIAFLSHLYKMQMYGPFMIVAPLSTLANWVNEFERFCPTLKTVLYHGSKKERSEIGKKKLNTGDSPLTLLTWHLLDPVCGYHWYLQSRLGIIGP